MKELPAIDPIEIAQKQRHLHLLGKIKENRHLSKTEIDELTELEGMAKKRKRKTNLAAGQLIETQKEAAEYAGVNTRTIRRWEDEGMPKTKEGHYIKGMLDMFKANKGKQITEDKVRLQSAEANYKETKAKLLEIELKIKQGQLLPLETIEKARIARIQAVKRALLGQGRKLAKRLAALKDPRKIRKLLDDENQSIIGGFAGTN